MAGMGLDNDAALRQVDRDEFVPPTDVRIIIVQVTASWSFLECAGLKISLVTKGAVTAGPVAIVNDDPYNFFQTKEPPDNRVHVCQLLHCCGHKKSSALQRSALSRKTIWTASGRASPKKFWLYQWGQKLFL